MLKLNKPLTLGSLFDGSGGFPLAGLLSGITPVWSSEIEPFPIRVTTKRLPLMKHYGDISAMNGAEIEPVDIITFGSPCQDMSIAGKRSGLDGNRSCLFYEAIRIVKEMRCKTNGKYPRYIVWENVPGAFSSNKGEDFKAVLDAIIGIKEQDAKVPMPEKGNWSYADILVGGGWSIAYRVLDAQFWGVPQRRRRIFLVADFADEGAGEILFKSEGLSGYSAESFSSWQRTARCFEDSVGATGFDGYNGCLTDDVSTTLGVNCGMPTGRNGIVLNDQGGERMDITDDVTCTLRAEAHHPPCVMESAGFCTEHSAKARGIGYEKETAPTLRAGVVPATVYENHGQDTRFTELDDVAPTVLSTYGTGGNNQPFVVNKPQAFGICSDGSNAMKSDNPKSGVYEADTSRTLDANGGNPGCNQGGIAIVENYDVRLTSEGTRNVRSNVYKTDIARTIDTGGNAPDSNQGGVAVVSVHCVDQGGGKSSCNFYENQAPTQACTHGGELVIAVQGSMIGRADRNGPQGSGVNEDISFTLNATDKHAVAYGIDRAAFNQGKNALYDFGIEEERQPTMVAKGPGAAAQPISFYPQMKAECMTPRENVANTLVNGTNPGFQNAVATPTYTSSKASFFTLAEEDVANILVATDYKDPPLVNEPEYTVRRLTPTECARLQGFPDKWCSELGTENPTEDNLIFWREVFETHRKITGTSAKPKTDKQIIKWLNNPHTDSAEYKMWGNGVALPCVVFVLSGIAWYDTKYHNN